MTTAEKRRHQLTVVERELQADHTSAFRRPPPTPSRSPPTNSTLHHSGERTLNRLPHAVNKSQTSTHSEMLHSL